MDSPAELQNLQDSLRSALLTTTRTTTELCAEDLVFHRSLDPSIARTLEKHNARLLGLAENLLGTVSQSTDVVGPKLQDSDALEANWRGVVDVVDSLLERVDITLDGLKGVVKRGVENGTEVAKSSTTNRFPKAMNILKPQRNFDVVPTNNEAGPWKPLLTAKPNAKVPLQKSLIIEPDGSYRHPYKTEIEEYKYPVSVYQQTEPIQYRPFESTTAIFVDTPKALEEMLAELKKAKEIAIDLEHHDMRTYVGIVSLMQISTRNQDWIVDTLKPWRRKLECLNEAFTDPQILKVFHGSGMDMIWLQRDLGIYMVGMFDTEPAARALRYPRAALAYLLEKHVKFQAQKQHQLADWRVRPLSQELFDYARADTHFLLYIYDCMRNELIQNSNLAIPDGDLLQKVLEGSKNYQLQRYEVPRYDAKQGMGQSGWYKMLLKTPVLFSKEQFAVFKALHQWRDNVAREDDDSIHYVMSNHALMSLSRVMPTQKEKFLSAASHLSASMRNRQDELVKVIAQARDAGKNGPEMKDVLMELDQVAAEQRRQKWAHGRERASVILAMTTSKPTFSPTTAPTPRKRVSIDPSTVRAEKSKFWGATLGSQTQKRSVSMDVRLALPLPQLTAEVFSDNSSFMPGTPVAQTPNSMVRPEHTFVPAASRPKLEEDDVFIIKELGGNGKKRKLAEAETATTSDDFGTQQDSLSIEEVSAKEQRRLAKAAKKSMKEAKKAREAQEADEVEIEEAFDYANAPSVLNAQAEMQKTKKGKKMKKDRGFDPYAKSADAPKGLPRAQREKAGRTATFKSL